MLADLSPGCPVPYRHEGGEEWIDLHSQLVPHPLSTFFMRVEGEGMRSHGIHSGDLLVIDRSVVPRPGSLLVAVHHGGFILRQLGWQGGQPVLLPATPGEHPIPMDLENGDATGLFGVVVHAVHHLANAPSRRR